MCIRDRFHDLQPTQGPAADAAQLFHADSGKAELFSLFGQGRKCRQSGHGESAALGHEVRRLAIDQRGVLDRAHAQGHRSPHRVHAIRNYGERIEVAAATVIAGPKVAMAAGLADGAATVEEPCLLYTSRCV